MDAALLDSWLDSSYRARGASDATIRTRAQVFGKFARDVGDPLTLDADGLAAYLAGLAIAPETRKGLCVALRSFYRYAYAHDLIAADLAASVPSVRVPRGQLPPAPVAVVQRARSAGDDEQRLIVDLAARMGLRRGEIARVHASDVSDLVLLVHGKGARDRLVPIHPAMRARLAAVEGYAFPGRFGGHASVDYVASRVEPLLGAWRLHSLRRRFATDVYTRTHDLPALQQLLGHASLETTQRYVWVGQDALVAAVNAVA